MTRPAVADRPELRVSLRTPFAVFGAWLVAQLLGAVLLQGLHGTVPDADRLFDPYFAVLLLGADLVLLAAVWWAVRGTPDPRAALGLVRPSSWSQALKLAVGGMLLVLVVAQLLEPLLHAAESQGLTPRPFPGGAQAWIGVVVAAVAFVVVAPVAEELFFRGLLFAALRGRLGPHLDAGGHRRDLRRAARRAPRVHLPGPARDRARGALRADRIGRSRDPPARRQQRARVRLRVRLVRVA